MSFEYRDALADLEARQPERMVPDLSRITAVSDLLDHPERTYPTIHVTGTNGKTTTARLITSLACEHGLPTGTYTSPHLDSVTERIALCSEPIPEDEFAEEYERLLPFLEEVDRRGERVTYFEALTALAFVWFADKPVSLGVFEVGMGGIWDATNLVNGDVAVLCPIALDHPELGSTVRDVATEKAGIIKEGKIAVCREQPKEAFRVIEARCREMEARLLREGQEFSLAGRLQGIGGQMLAVQGIHARYEELRLPFFGEHAARNAAAAVAAVEALLDRPLDEESVQRAFATASSPGRLEVLGRKPLLVVDGAHNPAGAEALARALPEPFTWDTLHMVIACSANKDVDGIVAALTQLRPRVYAARNSSPRSAPADRVAAACRDADLETEEFESVEEALAAARSEASESDVILVTGSLYTVADARRAILPSNG